MDLLTLSLEAAFFVVFGASLGRWLRRGRAIDRDVMLVFASVAGLFALSIITPAFPPIRQLSFLANTLLLAQPWLAIRLVRHFRPLSDRLEIGAFLGFVVSSVVSATIGPRTVLAVALIVGYFVSVEAAAAIELLREARRRLGVARWRLAIAGASTLLFALTILVLGVAAAAGSRGTDSVSLASRLLALGAGLGYMVAFMAPSWITSIPHRATAFGLSRELVSAPTGTEPRRLWEGVAASARDLLGADAVGILAADGTTIVATAFDAPPEGDAREPSEHLRRVVAGEDSAGPRQRVVRVPLVSDDRPAGELVALVRGDPLFVEDDLALISLLGSMTTRAVEREDAMVELGRAREALAESDALQASERRFRTLLDEHPNAVIVTDEDGRIVFSNRIAGELFGYDVDALATLRVEDLVPRPVRAAHREKRRAFQAAPTRLASGTGREFTALRSDGTTIPVEIALSPFRDGDRLLTIAVVSDISERRAREEVRETFLGMLSHELRTPVTSIYGGTQLLLNRPTLSEEQRRELLADVTAEAERLHRMIENLIVLARLERGADLSGSQPVMLRRLVPAVVEREAALWPGADFRVSIPPDTAVIAGDDDYLGQILRNLLSNAAKYAGADGPIEVVVRGDGDRVLLTVRDHGPGFSAADAEHLFELYFRATNVAATAPGAGIGLFVCRTLVEAMGGTLVASLSEDGGARFTVSLPVYVEAEQPIKAEAAADDGWSLLPRGEAAG